MVLLSVGWLGFDVLRAAATREMYVDRRAFGY